MTSLSTGRIAIPALPADAAPALGMTTGLGMTSTTPLVLRLVLAPLALLFALAPAPASAQVSLPPFLELRVPKPPTVATGESGSFLAYEVHVTNFVPQPIALKKLDVMAGSGDHRVLF